MFLTEDKTIPEHIERELDVLRTVDHPNIVPLLDVKSKVLGVPAWLVQGTAGSRTRRGPVAWPGDDGL